MRGDGKGQSAYQPNKALCAIHNAVWPFASDFEYPIVDHFITKYHHHFFYCQLLDGAHFMMPTLLEVSFLPTRIPDDPKNNDCLSCNHLRKYFNKIDRAAVAFLQYSGFF